MASFLATYTGPTGKPKTLTIKASDLIDARKQLRRRGIRATDVKPAAGDDKKGRGSDNANPQSFDLNKLFEQPPGV